MKSIPKPLGIKYSEIILGGVRQITAKPSLPNKKALLYLHGGGYVIGQPDTFKGLYGRIAKELNCTAYAPDYRLAPEHPFPAAIDDAVASYQSLLISYLPENIYISGDSAGGGLALALCLRLRELNLPQPKALYLISPLADLRFSNDSINIYNDADPVLNYATLEDWAKKYALDETRDNPLLSPALADFSGLSPMIIQVGSIEVLRDDSYAVKAAAEAAGVSVKLQLGEGLWHDWQALAPLIPEANIAIKSATDWLKSL